MDSLLHKARANREAALRAAGARRNTGLLRADPARLNWLAL